MEQEIMIKAFGRAALVTLVIVIMGLALWHYTIITLIVLVTGWLFVMFYTDPPEDWN